MIFTTGERAEPADGGDDQNDERARRRNHGHHHQPVRAADLQQQDRLEGECVWVVCVCFCFFFLTEYAVMYSMFCHFVFENTDVI